MDMNRASQNPRVLEATTLKPSGGAVPGVRVPFFFASGCLLIPFRLQSMVALKNGDTWQMWEFIRI